MITELKGQHGIEKETQAEGKPKDSILVSSAKAIGASVGKLASLAGAPPDANPTPPKTPKKSKLAKQDKSGLPRKQKKAQQKAGRARQG